MENQLNFSTLKVGDKVYSRMHGEMVEIELIDNLSKYPIYCGRDHFTKDGKWNTGGEQMLFPSKPLEFPREMEVSVFGQWEKQIVVAFHKGYYYTEDFKGYNTGRELQPPLVITREMLIEAFKTDNYTIEG
jgi:hypothetical protein